MTRCKSKDCKKQALFANHGNLRIFYSSHKKDGMINVVIKLCNESEPNLFQSIV